MKQLKDYISTSYAAGYLKITDKKLWDMARNGEILIYDRIFCKDPRFSKESLEAMAKVIHGESFVSYSDWIKNRSCRGKLKCKHCGKEFVGAFRCAKYCSIKCSRKFNNLKHNAKRKSERALEKSRGEYGTKL